jgi:hypothetical protein
VELLFVALTVATMPSRSNNRGMRNIALSLALLPLLSACVVGTIASTAVDVVTLPVKVASAGVDAVTTSSSEADEKRGRELRKQEEERGKQARQMAERCRKGRPQPTDICGVQPN